MRALHIYLLYFHTRCALRLFSYEYSRCWYTESACARACMCKCSCESLYFAIAWACACKMYGHSVPKPLIESVKDSNSIVAWEEAIGQFVCRFRDESIVSWYCVSWTDLLHIFSTEARKTPHAQWTAMTSKHMSPEWETRWRPEEKRSSIFFVSQWGLVTWHHAHSAVCFFNLWQKVTLTAKSDACSEWIFQMSQLRRSCRSSQEIIESSTLKMFKTAAFRCFFGVFWFQHVSTLRTRMCHAARYAIWRRCWGEASHGSIRRHCTKWPREYQAISSNLKSCSGTAWAEFCLCGWTDVTFL